MTQPLTPKLSICIGTFNRAAFLGATLESIIVQTTEVCEIVVSDNASTDNTEAVVSKFSRHFDRLRYIRQDTNKGFDRNFDCAVRLARGEYCWLFSDDDLMKPGAVARVLEALYRGFSLIMVNAEVRDFSMSKVLQHRSLDFNSNRVYGQGEMDRLFVEVKETLTYVGNIIIKRTIWLGRERERYYGSMYIHVGVIFQEHLPGETLVIAEPLVSYRMGNTVSYSSNMAEIAFFNWPSLVSTLAISESAKRKVGNVEPWKHPQWLLILRGWGLYSLIEYRRWIRPRLSSVHERVAPLLIALLPGVLVNTLLVLYYSTRHDRAYLLYTMRQSRFHLSNRKTLKREP